MRWNDSHLTYCLNIHPGETLAEVRKSIETYAAAVKGRVCPDEPFGLGLRLSAEAAGRLLPVAGEFREFLGGLGMYAFTVNGFPFGRFHGARVKEKAYLPDWSDSERVEYTVTLAEILARLLPEDVDGSVSTVPVCYGKEVPGGAMENVAACAVELLRIKNQTGRKVTLALEPEPGCAVETAAETVSLLSPFRELIPRGAGELVGVCLDTCHAACGFENPLDFLKEVESAGIPVPKIQVSSALRVGGDSDAAEILAPFADEVYLHQVRVKTAGGELLKYADLPDALGAAPRGEWRVHFHVPLHYRRSGGLDTTAGSIDGDFIEAACRGGRHVEIETYSFDVLPGGGGDVVDSISGEIEWLMSR